MKNKTKIMYSLTILVLAILILSIGTYAYFSAKIQDTRDKEQETTKFKTCKIAEATTISDIPQSIGNFQSIDIYPGHKEVIGMSVSARGDIHSVSNFEFLYHIEENTFGSNIKVSIYKSKEVIPTTENYFACEKKVKTLGNQVMYYEECQEKDLGSLVEETILSNNSETIRIGKDSIVVTSNQEEIRYYYVVLEFLNQEDNQNTTMSSKLSGNITINPILEKTSYKESILNGTDPILKDELIPVIIDNAGVVRKADEAEEWYRYENKTWANAVILKNENEMYCPGEIIPEDQIESYFVWIPKYRYQLWNLGNYSGLSSVNNNMSKEIPIIFGNEDTNDENTFECKTPAKSGQSGNCKVGDFMTHPAFLAFDSTGFWVGKFETGYLDAVSQSVENVNAPEKVQIKPNVYSWRGIQVANAFYTSYGYKRNLDSHMMKNTEWGAVAYLSYSKYGSHTDVRINNNNLRLTGYASVKEPTCGYTGDNRSCNQYGSAKEVTMPWNTLIGHLASTTGNITGIYDMSGGGNEYVMGVMVDKNGRPMSGRNSKSNSGFNGSFGCPTCDGDTSGKTSLTTGFPFPTDAKYYDAYQYAEVDKAYQRRILGDATGEMGPFGNATYGTQTRQIGSWYGDEAYFLNHWSPWFGRGGVFDPGTGAGLFNFVNGQGFASGPSFRIVLNIN